MQLAKTSGSLTTIALAETSAEVMLPPITESLRTHSKWRNQFYNSLKKGRDVIKSWLDAYGLSSEALLMEAQRDSVEIEEQLLDLDSHTKTSLHLLKVRSCNPLLKFTTVIIFRYCNS